MTNERRVILDLGWPCGSSVNNGIPSGYFLGELLELSYPSIDAFVLAIVFLSLGCMLYKCDLCKVYHQFPIDPHDYHLLGYTWNSQVYFDTVLTMGLHSTMMACQCSTLAVTQILNQHGLKTFNYLEGYIGAFPPTLATSQFHKLRELLYHLGLEESSDKSSQIIQPNTLQTP